MAQITWNNVAAPSLGESNSLFTQAIQSLKDAGIGLKDTAKDYQTVVRNRSHAILQDYINSAKTPEELQSEAFNIGFKNLQATLANEYDAVKVNEYKDNAVDKLTRRAGDAVALERNTLGLTTDKLKTEQDTNLAAWADKFGTGDFRTPDARALIGKMGGANALQALSAMRLQDNDTYTQEQGEARLKLEQEEAARKEVEFKASKPVRDLTGKVAGIQAGSIHSYSPEYVSNVASITSPEFVNSVKPYMPFIEQKAQAAGVPPEYVMFILNAETGGKVGLTSPTGVKGIMQVTGDTFNAFGRKGGDRTNPNDSIEAGINYLGYLIKKFPDDPLKALVAYNQGDGSDPKTGKGVGLAIQKATEAGNPEDWVNFLDKEGQGYAGKMRDFISYHKTGNDGRNTGFPDGLKTDTYTGGTGSAKGASTKTGDTPNYVLDMHKKLEKVRADTSVENAKKVLLADPSKTLGVWRNTNTTAGINIDVNNIADAIERLPEASTMGDDEKYYLATTALNEKEDRGFGGKRAWGVNTDGDKEKAKFLVDKAYKNRLKQKQELFNAQEKPVWMEGIREHAVTTKKPMYESAVDLGADELTIFKLGIESPTAAKARLLYASSNKKQSEADFVEEYVAKVAKGENPDPLTLPEILGKIKGSGNKASTSEASPSNVDALLAQFNKLEGQPTTTGHSAVVLSAEAQTRVARLTELINKKSTDPLTKRNLEMQRERLLNTGK